MTSVDTSITATSRDEARLSQLLLFGAVLLLFLVSGACGLLYQVVWTRKLVLLFGTTAYAVSTVLSIFFLGLAVGSLWGGRLADRTQRPLALYAIFEIIIGLWALAFLAMVGWGETVVVALLKAFDLSRATGVTMRALMALLFLAVPVTLMGATLPLLAKYVARDAALRGLRIGVLYSINTVGAVVGCAVTGFILIQALGYTRTTLLGAVANVAVGIVALMLVNRQPLGFLPARAVDSETRITLNAGSIPKLTIMAAFALSGFAALALEVIWTRLLAIVFLGTTYAFTTMLTTMLCGIALGSAFAALFVDRIRHRVSLFGAVEMLAGIACLGFLAAFPHLPALLAEYQQSGGYGWERVVRATFLFSFLVLFVPTFLFGMTFPIAVRAVAEQGRTLGRDVGRLYSANTFGGVLGAVAGGFLIIPALGAHNGVVLLALVLIVVGVVLVLRCPTAARWVKALLIVAGLGGTGISYWAAPADVSLAVNQWFLPEDHMIIHYDEGIEGTVVVSALKEGDTGTDRVLWINAVQATASIEKGVRMNRFQGVLPLLFEQRPENALFMCLGSGITAGTLGVAGFEHIDAVEISRDVLEAAPMFALDNFQVTENEKITFHIDDGRNFLLTTSKKYDLITFEPMPLALAGVSTFYTQEYYELCLQHLTPGGLVSQWVPLHSLNEDLVRSLVYTFTTVFPYYNAWFVNADLFLIGSNEPLILDYAAALDRLRIGPLWRGLEAVGLGDVVELYASFFMGQENMRAYAEGGRLMRDDRPWAEFVAPKLMYQRKVQDTLEELMPYYESPLPYMRFDGMGADEVEAARAMIETRSRARVKKYHGLVAYYGGLVLDDTAQDLFMEALTIDPNDLTSRYYLTEIAVARSNAYERWEEYAKAVDILGKAIRLAPMQARLHLRLGDVLYSADMPEKAAASYRSYLALGGDEPRARERIRAGSVPAANGNTAAPRPE
jgi:spermidine synthase